MGRTPGLVTLLVVFQRPFLDVCQEEVSLGEEKSGRDPVPRTNPNL